MNSLQKKTFFEKNKYIFFSFLSAAGVMLLIYLITGVFPFGDKTVLRMDLYHQYGPLFAELYDKVKSGGSLFYSWQSGLGSCFLGNFFNYLSSPLAAVIMFFNHENIPEAIGLMVLIKAALSSATFTYYLKKSQHNHSVTTVMFGISYAFCAYMIAYYWNVMWLDAMVLLPVILLGIERIIDSGNIWLYVFSLSLSMFSNYYMSYMLCLFSVIYFFYYYISTKPSGDILSTEFEKENRKSLINKLKNRRFFRVCFLFGIGSLISGGLIAFALLPTYSILKTCSATSGKFPEDVKLYFNMFDFIINHLPSVETTIRSSGDDVLPNVYSGMLALLMAPLYFFTKSVSKKEKVATLGLLATLYMSFNTNASNYIWHGFHFPNDLPYRFSFMYSFIFLVMAYKTFVRINEFTSRQIGSVGAVVIFAAALTDKIGSKNFDMSTLFITLTFTVIFVLLLTLLKDKKYEVASVAILLCVCVASEVIVGQVKNFPNNITKSSYEADYEDFRLVKDHIDTIENDKFYRMELTSLRTRMDPSWFGYNGTSVFSSMAYENLSKLQDRLGMMSNGINSYTYNPQTPVYNMMHSIKYVVNNKAPNVLSDKYYEHLTSVDKYDLYQNKYYLPLAYCVDSRITEWDVRKDDSSRNVDPFEIQGQYFDKATGGIGNPFEKLDISYINYSNVNAFTNDISDGVYTYYKTTYDQDGSATFHITTQKTGNVYIYFNVDYASEKDITVNSVHGTISHNATHDCVLDLGRFYENQTVSVTIPFEANSGTVRLRVYTMNDEIFEKGYKKLNQTTMTVTSFEDTYISGKFTAKKDCVLYTSIPYDTGWGMLIDGETVTESDIISLGDGFIAVNVKKGNHEISFEYTPKGLSAGIKISVVCALIVVFMLLISILNKKRGKKSKLPAFEAINNKFDEYIIIEKSVSNKALVKEIRPISYPVSSGLPERIIITPPGKAVKYENTETVFFVKNISETDEFNITDEDSE